MVQFIWKKARPLEKIVFCVGWIGVTNLLFWITIVIVGNLNYGKKFWDGKTYFVVYVWGWIYFFIIATFLIILFGMLFA